ncbi:MAG: hypothetical protein EA378_10465 [Phycisphaerales bacterium]|nr:MAG: hypothetical protein EA378_10465 [Phycisphaerales bacterium]
MTNPPTHEPLWTEADQTGKPANTRAPAPRPPGPVRRWWRDCKDGKKEARRIAVIIGLAGAIAFLTGLTVALMPTRVPDYASDPLNKVFDFTFLTEDFNSLPIERRLELISTLTSRLQSMGSGESAVMAAFAAGIVGSARDQLERNASRLALDMFDSYATDYRTVPDADREAFLDQKYIEFARTMAMLTGADPDARTDEERLERGQRQAQRDADRVRENRPSGEQTAGIFRFLDQGIGGHATPQQRARVAVLVSDMGKRLRGEPISGRETARGR